MNTAVQGVTDEELVRWVELCACDHSAALASGYQGVVYLFNDNGRRFAIKAASGRGPMRWLRCRMLRNEFKAYSRLTGLPGCPRCYGLIDGRYLVLEYLEGQSLRHGEAEDRPKYYAELFCLISELHHRGIAHFDLKRKNNLMVLPAGSPGIVDFGVSIVRKHGFAPINHFLYDLAVQIDFNAWIKHKYRKRYSEVSAADRAYLRHTRTEKVVRVIKRVCHALRFIFSDGRARNAVIRERNAVRGHSSPRSDAFDGRQRSDGTAVCDGLNAVKPASRDC